MKLHNGELTRQLWIKTIVLLKNASLHVPNLTDLHLVNADNWIMKTHASTALQRSRPKCAPATWGWAGAVAQAPRATSALPAYIQGTSKTGETTTKGMFISMPKKKKKKSTYFFMRVFHKRSEDPMHARCALHLAKPYILITLPMNSWGAPA